MVVGFPATIFFNEGIVTWILSPPFKSNPV